MRRARRASACAMRETGWRSSPSGPCTGTAARIPGYHPAGLWKYGRVSRPLAKQMCFPKRCRCRETIPTNVLPNWKGSQVCVKSSPGYDDGVFVGGRGSGKGLHVDQAPNSFTAAMSVCGCVCGCRICSISFEVTFCETHRFQSVRTFPEISSCCLSSLFSLNLCQKVFNTEAESERSLCRATSILHRSGDLRKLEKDGRVDGAFSHGHGAKSFRRRPHKLTVESPSDIPQGAGSSRFGRIKHGVSCSAASLRGGSRIPAQLQSSSGKYGCIWLRIF